MSTTKMVVTTDEQWDSFPAWENMKSADVDYDDDEDEDETEDEEEKDITVCE